MPIIKEMMDRATLELDTHQNAVWQKIVNIVNKFNQIPTQTTKDQSIMVKKEDLLTLLLELKAKIKQLSGLLYGGQKPTISKSGRFITDDLSEALEIIDRIVEGQDTQHYDRSLLAIKFVLNIS